MNIPDPRTAGVDPTVLWIALGALFISLTMIVATALGLLTRGQRPEERMQRRLSVYTITGRQPRPSREASSTMTTVLGSNPVARTAVEFADRVTASQGLDTAVGARLEAAGLPLRTGEWLLIHIGTATGVAILFLLLSGRSLPATIFGLGIGLLAPWMFLILRQTHRNQAFLAQLPDTLQLMAGSLAAGYSLPQALDSVVREVAAPMSSEFNRALIEARLGVQVEDALDGIATRMQSKDFSWIVMAVRIQREVGGNLAELLTTVAETIRERERLRRQVLTLSAEGRLSAWVLGSLPVAFAGYLTVAKPDYLAQLFNPLGFVLLGTAAVLLTVGVLWLVRVIKVDV